MRKHELLFAIRHSQNSPRMSVTSMMYAVQCINQQSFSIACSTGCLLKVCLAWYSHNF